MMEIKTEPQDGITTVTLYGRLDAGGAPEVEAHCKKLIDQGDTCLLIDMEHVAYISSAGLRSLLVVAKTIKASKGELALCSLTPMVKEVMEISGFDKIFALAADRGTGQELLGSAG